MKVIAFQAKVSRWIENFDRDGYFCLRGCFWLEKPNFHKELQVTNFELRMRSSALFNLRLSTWTYLFFSRRSTLIFFSQINADLFSAPICDFNLRISAWTVFSEFSHPRPNIPQNYSPLKIRGVPLKAEGCYDVMDNWELTRNREMGSREWITSYEFRITNAIICAFSICDYLREPVCFFLADQRWFISRWFTQIFFCAHLLFSAWNNL
jgi:hypothetical protein